MLFIKRTVLLIANWDELGYFTVFKMFFCSRLIRTTYSRSFRVKSNTTIKIYNGHDVLLSNGVHHVIERNGLLENMTTF